MNTYSRILAALLLLSGGGLMACDDSSGGGGDENDSGEPPEDDGGEPEDAGRSDTGGRDAGADAGGSEDDPEELDKCPTHPNVTSTGSFCVLSAAIGNEIKEDLELAPVKDKMGYLINKSVFVGEDVGGKASPDSAKKRVTLAIKKGTTLYGADALSFMLINRGSKIEAEGTAKHPIVFTSGAAGAPRPGRWGGLIVNGRAPSNRADANGDVNGEAGTGKYSGSDAADNSGTLKYVRIEFSGGKIDDRNELNGLALQGVGRGTTLDYIHIHGGDDDGIEFFGGTVNAKHIAITAFADDAIDWTDGWTGKLQFALAQQWTYTNPGTGTNDGANGIEADNNDQGTFNQSPNSNPTLSNVTLIGASDITAAVGGHGMNLRRGTQGNLHNFVVLNFKSSCISLRDPVTAGYVGDSLTTTNSRAFCSNMYQASASGAPFPDATAAAKLFEMGDANEKLADADAALTKPYEQSEDADFTPKTDSGLLTGGKAPSDSFFEKVEFIGAFGDGDSWLEGEWFKITPFST
jgi:hypothetical protein